MPLKKRFVRVIKVKEAKKHLAQAENLRIFVLLRFYVKPTSEALDFDELNEDAVFLQGITYKFTAI